MNAFNVIYFVQFSTENINEREVKFIEKKIYVGFIPIRGIYVCTE